ncbi:MAG: 6-phospho-beta-glucosidase [Clostridiales bacterium]|nr:6-phospho-beta-glucosidase [Clostridiales bacterium]
MKFTIVGAGSSYTPELLEEMCIRRETLPVKEIVLMDVNEKRLDIMTGFCKRFAAKRGLDVPIRSTLSLDDALEGADFVDTQIRVGGNKQRVIDEKIPLKYGLVGQETTGAGGMMKAFRTIPVMLDLAQRMEKLSPNGWIINYTNPTGLVTEAVTRNTKANIAGFCSGGIFPKMWAKKALGVEYRQVQYDYVGLNHMNFISNVTIDGRPVTQEEFEKLAQRNRSVDPELTKLLGVLTSPYLQWYYQTTKRVKELQAAPLTRGEEVQLLEKEVYDGYADPNNADTPEALYRRGGGGYSEVAMNFVNAVYNNVDTEMVVNVPNNGAIPFLPDSAVVEIPCLVNRRGMSPLHVGKIPPMCWGLIAAVKNYEQLAVEAAVEGDVTKMKWALLAHPLVREYELVEKLVPELLEANRKYLPQFFPKEG